MLQNIGRHIVGVVYHPVGGHVVEVVLEVGQEPVSYTHLGHQFQFALSNWLDLTDRCWIALFILKADAGGIMVSLAFISIDRLSLSLIHILPPLNIITGQ